MSKIWQRDTYVNHYGGGLRWRRGRGLTGEEWNGGVAAALERESKTKNEKDFGLVG